MNMKLLAVTFLVLFLAEEIMITESVIQRMCHSRSREFRGRCRGRNGVCNIVCHHEGFSSGRCNKRDRCYCSNPCNSGPPKTPVPQPPEDDSPDIGGDEPNPGGEEPQFGGGPGTGGQYGGGKPGNGGQYGGKPGKAGQYGGKPGKGGQYGGRP